MTCRRVLCPVVLGLALLPWDGGVAMADITISGFFSQQIEARDGGSDGDDPESLRSVTDLGITFRGSTPRTEWTLAPGARGFLSTDPDDSPAVTPRLSASLRHGGPITSLTASLSVVPDFTDETQFEDTGRSEADVLQISTNARIGLSHSLGPRDTISLGLGGTSRDFLGDPETLSASRSLSLDSSWRRTLTSTTAASASPALRFFVSDAENGSDGATLSLPLGFDTRLAPTTTLAASLGPSLTWSARDGESTQTDLGTTGSLTLNWRDDDTTAVIGLNQSVDQTSDGVLENRASLRIGVGQQLTRRSRVSFNASAGLQTGLSGGGGDREDGDRRTLSFSPSYSYNLSEDWSVDVNYRLRVSDDDDGTDYTNAVFLRVSRGLTLLP